MSTKLKNLQDAGQVALKEARDVAEKAAADNRPLNSDEKSIYDAAMVKGRQILEQIKAAKADDEILAQAKALAELIGSDAVADLDAQSPSHTPDVKARVKSLGLQVVESTQFKSLMGSFGDRIPEKARVHSDPIGVKALITGGSATSAGAFVTAEQTGIVEMLGRRPLTIRQAISVRPTASDAVEYVRQVGRTNAAAVVAEATSSAPRTAPGSAGPLVDVAGSGRKPEGGFTFERDVATIKTIAEWVPATKRALSDVGALAAMIDQELVADLAEAEEAEIVSGSGVGEHLPGILTTPGTQAQAFSTDLFVTIRKALTKARIVGRVTPNAIGLNPADVETVDLARDLEGRFYGAGPFASGPRTLWGVPILESEAFVAGQAVVADYSKAVLWDREQSSVTISDSHEDFFTRNLVAVLAEERVGFAITRPSAFVLADLTA